MSCGLHGALFEDIQLFKGGGGDFRGAENFGWLQSMQTAE